MATRRNYQERQSSNAPAWALVMITMLAVTGFLAFLWPELAHMPGSPEQAKKGAQAPPAQKGTFGGADSLSVAPAAIDAYNATSQAQYDAAVQSSAPVATPMPLPLNSAGAPVISQEQQAQMNQSLILAEQEGAAAADAQLAAQRAQANADAAQRAPDVSYEDAKALLGRDPCHVPHANPATCASGLYKPTPVN